MGYSRLVWVREFISPFFFFAPNHNNGVMNMSTCLPNNEHAPTATASAPLRRWAAVAAAVVGLAAAPISQAAEDKWTFGIGTGLQSLNLDGDVVFATEDGGFIGDLDLDNGDTADMFESAFGFASFANKGRWTIHLGYGTLTLEDDDADLDAEWDRVEANLAVEYMFYQAGKHQFGVLAGVRMYDHEWEFQINSTGEKVEPEDDWTDGVLGLTHRVPFGKNWAWTNRVEYMGGDSEGGFTLQTGLNWQPYDHWVFNGGLRYQDLEFGEEDDINDNDFYYYDVEETTIGIGFMYVW